MDVKSRINALDGLRGLAAFVVLCSHVLLVFPSLANGEAKRGSWAWLLTYSPLHLLWSGTEAVVVFFVLSGFVLCAPWSGTNSRPDWLSYYPSRLVRLYLPVLVSLVVAYVLILLVARTSYAGGSVWLNEHASAPHGLAETVREAGLLGSAGWVNSPLWSLRYEVAFSLVLPAYVWFGNIKPRLVWLKVAMLAVVILVGAHGYHGFLTYMPMFGFGSLLARHRQDLQLFASRLSRSGWLGLLTGSLLLLDASSYVSGLAMPPSSLHRLVAAVAVVVVTAAAAGIVFVGMAWEPAGRVLTSQMPRWLGQRSFSLYLIHEPIVVTLAIVLRGHAIAPLFAAVAGVMSLVAAELFYRFVERSSHQLSRQLRHQIIASGVGRRSSAAMPT